jgi:hypothetical protein
VHFCCLLAACSIIGNSKCKTEGRRQAGAQFEAANIPPSGHRLDSTSFHHGSWEL